MRSARLRLRGSRRRFEAVAAVAAAQAPRVGSRSRTARSAGSAILAEVAVSAMLDAAVDLSIRIAARCAVSTSTP